MSDIEIYESPDGEIRLNVQLEDETVWLTQRQMSALFGRDKSTISRHIQSVFDDGELEADSTVANFATVDSCRSSPSEKTFLI